ncbi:MAG: septal ring lytic transglycosylase RlpA family protein [Terracidiphilus sp.]|jgi:rare lipoprotein A
MVIARKPGPTNLKTQVGICLLAGISSIALAGVVVTLSTPAVQADVKLSRPAATMPPAAPILSETPALLAPPIARKSKLDKGADLLHGIASWYGSVLNGHRTASGERFDMYAMTACHPTLPFGTLVRVVDQNTKRSVVVRINDRGILDEGRIIDLSYAAAQELKITKAGLAPVALEIISLGQPKHRK